MLRLWREIHAEKLPISASAALSVIAHAALIAGAVSATQRPTQLEDLSDELANRPYYIPPPNRVPRQFAMTEHLQFIALTPQGASSGFGPASFDSFKPVQDAHSTTATGDVGRDSVTLAAREPMVGGDSVLTEVEVDSAARRDPSSAAPSYPAELLKKNVEGYVSARYVVDTTGSADAATLAVLYATDPLFVQAVRDALPFMRFEPARLHGNKVRQLVQQQFTFRIVPPKLTETAKKP